MFYATIALVTTLGFLFFLPMWKLAAHRSRPGCGLGAGGSTDGTQPALCGLPRCTGRAGHEPIAAPGGEGVLQGRWSWSLSSCFLQPPIVVRAALALG